MRPFLPLLLLALLCGCNVGGASAPVPIATATPTIDVAPTQTRAAELSQIATLTAPTATATPRPTSTPTSPSRIPTLYVTPPALSSHPTRAQACIAIEQVAAGYGMAFDPRVPPEVTVDILLRRAGVDPAINSGYRVFSGNALLEQILICIER